MNALLSISSTNAFRHLFVSLMLVVELGCTTATHFADECEGELVSLAVNDVEHVTCWINYDERNAFRQGPYRLIVDGSLAITGNYEKDRIAGIWRKYDDMGNIVAICDFSTETTCEL